MQITKIRLQGLTCAACTKVTAKRIKQIPGVTETIVSLESGMAEITADRAISRNEIAQALKATKYSVE